MSPWITCQLGAREHYAIPRALIHNDALQLLCTDVWAGSVLRKFAHLAGRRGHSLASRYHPNIPSDAVKHWTASAMARRLYGEARPGSRYESFIKEGRWFARRVCKWLGQREALPRTLFSYDTTSLEIFEWAKPLGIRLILGQMDPDRVETEIVEAERERWPGWDRNAVAVPRTYYERRQAEWKLADQIIVNSRWSRDALIRLGVPSEKLRVIPLVYEAAQNEAQPNHHGDSQGPLRVLFLGQVNLRKGIPYLIEAAKQLDPNTVEFVVVGPIQISELAMKTAPRNVRFVGPVSRSEVSKQYRAADVFLLPTLSDGFAITQLEAMAHGLPVIATPNCGEVVTANEDGMIVPTRDGGALATAIEFLASDRERVVAMGHNALAKSRLFGIDRLALQLSQLSLIDARPRDETACSV